jgi:arsenate reductase (thioredoxin)
MGEVAPLDGKRQRVLFVCVENCCRSQMAEAFARRQGGGRVEAYSAGVRPAQRVHPKAVAAMAEVGYDLGTHRPKGLGEVPIVEFDAVVAMGCGGLDSPVLARRYEAWDIPAPKDLPADQFRAVRDRIEGEVSELLARLELTRRPS